MRAAEERSEDGTTSHSHSLTLSHSHTLTSSHTHTLTLPHSRRSVRRTGRPIPSASRSSAPLCFLVAYFRLQSQQALKVNSWTLVAGVRSWVRQRLEGPTGFTRNRGQALPLGWSYAPRASPTVGWCVSFTSSPPVRPP